MMRIPDWITGPLLILATVAGLFLLAMFVISVVIPGVWFTATLGYSMCSTRYPYMDFTSLHETTCSILPGDALIFVHVPPHVGDVVCVMDKTRGGVICHRAYKVTDKEVCIVGDAAYWKDCYSLTPNGSKYYLGKVIAKVPRAIAMPGIILWGIAHGFWNVITIVNTGSYALVR